MFDYNDLSLGIVEAARSLTSYYIVGFYSNHTALDGKFHRVKITVELRRSRRTSRTARATTPTRSSRSSPTPTRSGSSSRRWCSTIPVTDLTIAMEVNYFQLNRAEYFVPVVDEDSRQRAGAGPQAAARRTR